MDKEVIELALAEKRILLTEDKDFGWLVFAARTDLPGVILMRFPASARRLVGETVAKFIRDHSKKLAGAFVVLRPGSARLVAAPTTSSPPATFSALR